MNIMIAVIEKIHLQATKISYKEDCDIENEVKVTQS